jgi:hypothetical protein
MLEAFRALYSDMSTRHEYALAHVAEKFRW